MNPVRELELKGFPPAVAIPLLLTLALAIWAGASLLGWIP